MQTEKQGQTERQVRLFRNGRNQALRIPREFELDADEAIIHREGDKLVIEPVVREESLADLLTSWATEDKPSELPEIRMDDIEDPLVEPEDIF